MHGTDRWWMGATCPYWLPAALLALRADPDTAAAHAVAGPLAVFEGHEHGSCACTPPGPRPHPTLRTDAPRPAPASPVSPVHHPAGSVSALRHRARPTARTAAILGILLHATVRAERARVCVRVSGAVPLARGREMSMSMGDGDGIRR